MLETKTNHVWDRKQYFTIQYTVNRDVCFYTKNQVDFSNADIVQVGVNM